MTIRNNRDKQDNAWIKLILAFVAVLFVCTALSSCGEVAINEPLPESKGEYEKIVDKWFISSDRKVIVSPGTIANAKPINSDSDKYAKKLPLRIENKSNQRWISDCRPINDIADNFSFSASAMLARELEQKFKDSINKSNEAKGDKAIQGFGIYLKYENDKNPFFFLNLLEYDRDAKPETVYDLAIRVLFSRVTFDVGAVSAVGYLREGQSEPVLSKDGFGVFGNKANSKCVGFFVDPSLDVAFYGFEIKGNKTDGQISAINENIRVAYDRIDSLKKEKELLKTQLEESIGTEKTNREAADKKINLILNGDKDNKGLKARVGDIETKNDEIIGKSGSVTIQINNSSYSTSLTDIYKILQAIEKLDNSTLKGNLDSTYEKKRP